MTPQREDELLTADTAAYGVPIVLRHLRRAVVEADQFDLYVTLHHGSDDNVSSETAYAIARELRGNRSVEEKLADWHVRSLEPLRYLSDYGNHPKEGEIIGTQIWLSRTYRPPAAYNEKA